MGRPTFVLICAVVVVCSLTERRHNVQAQSTYQDDFYKEGCHSNCVADILERMSKLEKEVVYQKGVVKDLQREIVVQMGKVRDVENKLEVFEQQSDEKVKDLENKLNHQQPTTSPDTDDACNPNPCFNRGVCITSGDTYLCRCKKGFIGNTCTDIDTDPCALTPCQNDGTCISDNITYTCACKHGFGGDNCQIDLTDTSGKEFLVGFIRMRWGEVFVKRQMNEIVVSTPKDTEVTVTCKDPFYNKTFHMDANTTSRIHDLPLAVRQQTSGVLEEKGIHIKATEKVSVQGLIGNSHWAIDAFSAMPIDESFTHFVVATYNAHETQFSGGFMIVAKEDFTNVRLYSPVSGGGVALEKTILMNKLNTFGWYNNISDYTGYQVKSNKPIAVYAGVDFAKVHGKSKYRDALYESMSPVSRLGQKFIVPIVSDRHESAGMVIRVIAVFNDTEIKLLESSNQFNITLHESQSYAHNATSAAECASVTCSKPCQVVKYNRGYNSEACNSCHIIDTDAFMVPITPIKSFQKKAQFANLYYRLKNVTSPFLNNSVVVITDLQTLPYLRFNGQVYSEGWKSVPGWNDPSYWYNVFDMTEGFNELDATHENAGIGFAAYVQGYGSDFGGYGYRTGW